MEFQRYNEGIGLIAQNKFQSAMPNCPLCGNAVEWEIAFDFSGNLICILAKCPVCGGVVKTIFDFANEPVSTFSVSQIGDQNIGNLVEKTKYYVPQTQQPKYETYGSSNFYRNDSQSQNKPEKEDKSDSAGWGVLGFFLPIVGFILWLVWRNEYPKRARAAGIGCLVSVVLSVVGWVIYFVILIGVLGSAFSAVGAFSSLAMLLP